MGSGQRPLLNTKVVDALAYQGILIDRMSEGLTEKEELEEEYEQELFATGNLDEGRCFDTGY